MVLRFLLRFLANDEKLVQRLSESYPIRRAAQLFVIFFNHGKNLAQEQKLQEKLTPEQFRQLIRQFSDTAQRQIRRARESLKKPKL